ncbi:hypothetical protein EV44_g0511 [Erysiphe necator]|uniref:Uncharacterized protein n=1 Tax=Uncinula necator TaxID=52586 RepID=A0A0B1NZY7_UNCNE|nr:hypothetical protein EV44_g0511 [Erysiphe necator]
MKMKISLFIIANLLYTTLSLWIILPKFDVDCYGKDYYTSEMIADVLEPGCVKQSQMRRSKLRKFKPTRKLFSAKTFHDKDNPSKSIYEWNAWIKRYYPNRVTTFYHNRHFLRNPDLKIIFEYRENEDVCIPLYVFAIDRSGKKTRCTNIVNSWATFDYPSLIPVHAAKSEEIEVNDYSAGQRGHAAPLSPQSSGSRAV